VTTSGPVVRRAPFSDNPTVGPRGQRTQQRILDAALQVLRDEGYHRCSVDRITRLAGCSRVSFYQYFSGKEDVFYRLAGTVAAEVRASVEAIPPLTPDGAGRASVREWVAREAGIYHRYGPVFNAFGAVAAGTEAVAELGSRAGEQNIVRIRSRLAAAGSEAGPTAAATAVAAVGPAAGTTAPPREPRAVIALVLGCIARTFALAGALHSAAPKAYPRERIEQALADVLHRTFFGRLDGVNVHDPGGVAPPRLMFAASTRRMLGENSPAIDRADAAGQTVQTLLSAGRDVFVSRGYAGARIDDIVAAAGLSHGAFYQYFKNKNDLAHILVLEAMRPLGSAFVGMPSMTADTPADPTALRRWLRVYNASHVHEAALIRVWVDAQVHDASLGADAAPAIDWGRRRVASFLRPRGFGDVDAEAVVMVALLDAFGSQVRSNRVIDAVAHIIQRGLLGL
jgi:AcrR family transcriptional regulator